MMNTLTTNLSPAAARRTGYQVLALAVIGLLAGCDNSTGPAGGQSVSLSFGLGGGAANPAPALFAASSDYTDALGNQLVIDGAEVVLREIEFERVETIDCDTAVDEDACEEFETGPYHVSLPLDGSVATEIAAVVDTGTYDEIEFDVHKLSESDPADADLLALYPDLSDVSIKVTGTFNGQAFEYTSDLNEKQEIKLAQPLVITPETGAINVTLMLDLSSWFRDASGTLVDPQTAYKGQSNEQMVEDNIKTSIEGFQDDDHDGVPHDADPDEKGV